MSRVQTRRSVKRPVDLYVMGRGIAGVRQMTVETIEALKECRVVLDLSGEPDEIRKIHPNVVDLAPEYWRFELNSVIYDRLENLILRETQKGGPTVGHITDGHPLIFDDVSWALVRNGRRLGLKVVALPAISCLDVMVRDLGIDIGNGIQILEVNQILRHEISLNPQLDTLIFQIGNFGTSFISPPARRSRKGRFIPLLNYLLHFFPKRHQVTLVVSSGTAKPILRRRLPLVALDDKRDLISEYADFGLTLYIPARPRQVNTAISKRLDSKNHVTQIAHLRSERQ